MAVPRDTIGLARGARSPTQVKVLPGSWMEAKAETLQNCWIFKDFPDFQEPLGGDRALLPPAGLLAGGLGMVRGDLQVLAHPLSAGAGPGAGGRGVISPLRTPQRTEPRMSGPGGVSSPLTPSQVLGTGGARCWRSCPSPARPISPERPPTSIFFRFLASRMQTVSFPAVGTYRREMQISPSFSGCQTGWGGRESEPPQGTVSQCRDVVPASFTPNPAQAQPSTPHTRV